MEEKSVYFGPCPGDIIVMRDRSTSSFIIRFLQSPFGRQFSHVALVNNRDKIFHSTPFHGVKTDPLFDKLSTDGLEYKVFRSPSVQKFIDSKSIDDWETRFITGLDDFVGKHYNWAFYAKDLLTRHPKSSYFCSELVVERLKELGIETFERKSDRIFPRQLKRLDQTHHWLDVTKIYFQYISLIRNRQF